MSVILDMSNLVLVLKTQSISVIAFSNYAGSGGYNYRFGLARSPAHLREDCNSATPADPSLSPNYFPHSTFLALYIEVEVELDGRSVRSPSEIPLIQLSFDHSALTPRVEWRCGGSRTALSVGSDCPETHEYVQRNLTTMTVPRLFAFYSSMRV